MTPDKPTLTYAIKKAINYELNKVNTCIPAVIESYEYKKQKATVKPTVRIKLTSGNEMELPSITNVPVVFPKSGKASLVFPVDKGDHVLLVFSQRSIDEYINSGSISSTTTDRKFSLNDAFAIVGVLPFNETSQVSSGDKVELTYRNFKISIDKSGKIAIGKGAIELLDIIDDLISLFDNALSPIGQVVVASGSSAGTYPVLPTQIAPEALALKTKITQIKGSL